VVEALEWSSCVILYDDPEGLVRLQEVLKMNPIRREIQVTVRQLEGQDVRSILKELKKQGETRFILECKFSKSADILRQDQEVGLMTGYDSIFVTHLVGYLVCARQLTFIP